MESLEGVLEDLRNAQVPSIDSYLEHRQGSAETMQLGRRLIALTLGARMHPAQRLKVSRQQHDEDWLLYLFERMRRGAPTVADFVHGNRVSFVTFNFDSEIEDRLAKVIRTVWGPTESPDRVADAIASVARVIHVHGRVPPVPKNPLLFSDAHGPAPGWVEWLLEAAEKVRVVHDQIDRSLVDQARQAIGGASVICFLGFGWDQGNFMRLGFPEIVENRPSRPDLYATAFRATTGEGAAIQRRLPGIQLGTPDLDCCGLLRQFDIARDS